MPPFVTVARLAEIPEGRVKIVNVGDEHIALANVEGSVFAIEDRCSHDDGPLGEGRLRGHEIECPRHGARFDVKNGRPLCLPAVVPVRTYAVKVEGDEVKVSLG
jgi:3-phenylpropionate/trans-cinnamate dioxygenase ferredoxin component